MLIVGWHLVSGVIDKSGKIKDEIVLIEIVSPKIIFRLFYSPYVEKVLYFRVG